MLKLLTRRGSEARSLRYRQELDEDIRMTVLTWNLGNAAPPKDLSDIFGKRSEVDEDLVVIGLQECIYTADDPNEMRNRHKRNKRLIKLLKKHDSHLMQCVQGFLGTDYLPTAFHDFGQMKLAVFVRAHVDRHVYGYKLGREATGVMRVIANKGGIGVRFSVGNYKIAVITTHLNAHAGEDRKQLRHEDTREILNGLKSLSDFGCDAYGAFHHVLWIGDLNYRFNLEQVSSLDKVPDSHEERFRLVESWIKERQWEKLNEADEFKPDKDAGVVLSEFQEGAMLFPPTYKVERETELKYRDQRIPAYCDRILWRSMPGLKGNITQTSLQPLLDVPTSDHKPLRASFSIRVKHQIEKPRLPGRKLRLVFDELSAHNIKDQDWTGQSDVYVAFQSPDDLLRHFGKRAKTTSIQYGNLNPVWPAKDIPQLQLRHREQELELIRASHLTLVLFDWDRASRHDFLGSAQISLEDIEVGDAISFEAHVLRLGVRAGTITGQCRLALA